MSWHLHDVALAAASSSGVVGTGGMGSTFIPSGGNGVSGSTTAGLNAAWWGASLLPQFALDGGFTYTGSTLTESLAGLAGGLGGGMATAPRFFLLLNGVLAFMLNVVSFEANRRVGAVGMSVAANVKQVLAVLFSVTLFNLSISSMNALGIALTILGGAWYAHVEIQEKKSRSSSLSLSLSHSRSPSLSLSLSHSRSPSHSLSHSPSLSRSSSSSPQSRSTPPRFPTHTKQKVSGPVGPYLDKSTVMVCADIDIEKVEMERDCASKSERRRQLRGDGQV